MSGRTATTKAASVMSVRLTGKRRAEEIGESTAANTGITSKMASIKISNCAAVAEADETKTVSSSSFEFDFELRCKQDGGGGNGGKFDRVEFRSTQLKHRGGAGNEWALFPGNVLYHVVKEPIGVGKAKIKHNGEVMRYVIDVSSGVGDNEAIRCLSSDFGVMAALLRAFCENHHSNTVSAVKPPMSSCKLASSIKLNPDVMRAIKQVVIPYECDLIGVLINLGFIANDSRETLTFRDYPEIYRHFTFEGGLGANIKKRGEHVDARAAVELLSHVLDLKFNLPSLPAHENLGRLVVCSKHDIETLSMLSDEDKNYLIFVIDKMKSDAQFVTEVKALAKVELKAELLFTPCGGGGGGDDDDAGDDGSVEGGADGYFSFAARPL